MSTKTVRQSNYELMRIISMFFIVIWHIIIHGNLLYNCSPLICNILWLVLFIIVVHVNSFILITGYFQYNKDFSIKKFFITFMPSWFYKIIIPMVLILLGTITLSKWEMFQAINPIGYSYWFIITYLLLYLLSPFLNIVIKNLDKKQHQKLLITLFILFSVLPFITNQTYGTNNGQNIIQFVLLYFVGAYLHKYPIKNFKSKKQLIIGFICCILLNYAFYAIENLIGNSNNSALIYVKETFQANLLAYSNPIIIIQSIIYFLLFNTFKFKNKIINTISPLMFGIYLIHDNRYIRKPLYDNIFNLLNHTKFTNPKLIIYILVISIIIFTSCLIIEYIRQLCSRKIHQLKFIEKINYKFYNILSQKKS